MADAVTAKMKGLMERVKHPVPTKKKKKEDEKEEEEEEVVEDSGNVDEIDDSDTIIKSSKTWDIKMPPIKKHMVGDHLMPTAKATLQVVLQKHRRLAIEVHAPKEKGASAATTTTPERRLEHVHTLENEETVFVKIYKDLNKEPEAQGPLGAVGLSKIPSPIHKQGDKEENWKEHASFRLEDVVILKTLHKHTCEVRLGSGHEMIIRDFIFESEEENEDFKEMLDKAQDLEHQRAQRQVALYREKRAKMDTISLLVEIVSAINLPVADVYSTDAYVICRMGNKEIHRTGVISQDLDPIWTLSTGSLFLVQMTPEQFFACTGGMVFVLKDYDSLGANELLGRVTVSLEELLTRGTGERKEYDIMSTAEFKSDKKSKLVLRYREATQDDIEFMNVYKQQKTKKSSVGVYSEETFLPPRPPNVKLLKRQNKTDENKQIKHRVKPHPDPSRESETKWMTKEEIEEDAYKQSTSWTEVGSGGLGKLYFEVIGCDDLPNADFATLDLTDKTDAFCCLVFEDGIVNTDVIGNCLSPRWPSWSRRAFVFNIAHPCSDILLGVFDFDPELSPIQLASRAASELHDPVGRIRIDLSNFVHSAVYTLKYNLYAGEATEDRVTPQGTMTVRLRIQWNDILKAYFASIKIPSPQYVSVKKQIYFDVAHYTTEGAHDEKEFNMNAFTEYIEEMQSNKIIFEYMKEALLTVWLWRGHFPVKISGQEYSLPLHSMTAFAWGILVTCNYNYFPSFLFFCIAWVMLACNEYRRQNPSPWHKPRSYKALMMCTGERSIEPNQNMEEIEAYNASIKKRKEAREKKRELEAKHDAAMKKELGDDANDAEASEDITTKKVNLIQGMQVNVNPLKPVLYPVQLKLHKLVMAFRVGKGIVLWDDAFGSYWIVTISFAVSAVTFFIPWGFICRWTLRVLAWVLLGPWMAMVDRFYFRDKPGLTDEEKDANVEEKLKAKYEEALKASTAYRVRKERAVKLKDIKKYMFGSFLVRVPRFAEDLYKDTPLPASSAKPFDPSTAEEVNVTERKYGQQLTGDMIPKRDIQVAAMKMTTRSQMKTGFFGVKGLGDPEKVPLLGTALGPKNPLFAYRKKKDYDAVDNEKKKS